ncbi:E3 ubiquitin-protein ligase RNF4-like isoform X1 [Camellia sinensis]|uniref:E3 ubiquitin-protein ligase RNF4-like isoform X1 n=1 Tax=Camellia sinensis TaxID=4442 RepID=UPI0010367D48|nr:E3 ubiquitin-protein ligase RNF4-like isoform X1 [Camellia sinensis]XP_028079990.1 E3 ubiquitin-protein ligase RNF4-like isoform X1 [Camellia sinensis]XP_028079991.1 E3 ubiquitin-protein ligase RNF4-like isoform X1 [Camellia sinensis]XP_028079992.1 E3 ubiquitin-protein ligase RNF4-like isoform X1 [Camellia sinensis]
MSTRGLRAPALRGYVRNTRRRKMVLDVDLNVPPIENRDQEGTSAHANSQDMEPGQQGGPVPPAPIDVDDLDDDVVISTSRAFAEAKNNSRRNRGSTIVVDVDSEERMSRVASNTRNKRRRVNTNQTIINCDLYINLEGTSNSMFLAHLYAVQGSIGLGECVALSLLKENVQCVKPSPPPPKEPTFNCPVCMGPLVEEMSTKCGHIFCKTCIKAAIAAQGKCPTCRRKVTTMKETIRIYLPRAN